MAYYTALIDAWNNPTQPPPGITGTGLSGLNTEQKIAAVNGWMVVGPSAPMIIQTYRIYNLIVGSEFSALTNANQQLVRDILNMGTVDASAGTQIRSRITALFPNGTNTFANLANLAATFDSPVIPWWSASVVQGGGGLSSPVGHPDLQAAGGLT